MSQMAGGRRTVHPLFHFAMRQDSPRDDAEGCMRGRKLGE